MNLFNPGALWRDTEGTPINAHGGSVIFHEGVYYGHGENKVAGRRAISSKWAWGVYSSKDLHAWKNEGTALAVGGVRRPDPRLHP